MLELLLLLGAPASAEPTPGGSPDRGPGAGTSRERVPVVVTFDNGEFDAPRYTPRWNGKWKQPSAAQEIAASVARVAGANPEVHTYLPPGQGRAGPGGHTLVRPIKAGCAAPGEAPGDPCWCSPADNCWSELQPNWYPQASTSLYLTAQNLRAAAGAGPRLEVHVTDLFEEDPSAAEDPADSDRCVTHDGVRRAVTALTTAPDGAELDHLAIGLLRATIDPPPPGGSWGNTYGLAPEADGRCHSGRKTGSWEAGRAPLTMSMAIVVVGLDTAAQHAAVSAFLDGLVGQLDAGSFEFALLRVLEPSSARVVERVATARDLQPLHLEPLGPLPTVPCGLVGGVADLRSGGRPVPALEVAGRCDGSLDLALDLDALRSTFLAEAGVSPFVKHLTLTGSVALTADRSAFDARLSELRALGASERPLPMWSALEERALELAGPTPWSTTVEVRSVRITDLDSRPWTLVALTSTTVALLAGIGSAALGRWLHAARAMRRHWAVSLAGGRDPMLQRPIAAVIGAAQEEVERAWPLRVVLGFVAGMVAAVATGVGLLLAYGVLLG